MSVKSAYIAAIVLTSTVMGVEFVMVLEDQLVTDEVKVPPTLKTCAIFLHLMRPEYETCSRRFSVQRR